MTDFRAIRIDKDDHGQHADYVVMRERDLMEGDVDVDVAFSAINYKDGLAVTGKGPVVRRFPMIPGVDLAGRVTRSAHPDFASGDIVVATACGLGEAHYRRLCGKGAAIGRLARETAAAADAGARHGGRHRGTDRSVLRACAGAPWRAAAGRTRGGDGRDGGRRLFRRRIARQGWLARRRRHRTRRRRRLSETSGRDRDHRLATNSPLPGKPLQTQRFAVGVDTVGGVTLANLLAQTRFDGAVAACGNVGGMELPANVAPFILRGVSLLGVESVRPRIALRRAAWARIARDLDPDAIDAMSEIIPFDSALDRARSIVRDRFADASSSTWVCNFRSKAPVDRIVAQRRGPPRASERKYRWPAGPRPADHPGLSDLGL